jgi:hypothetical protein
MVSSPKMPAAPDPVATANAQGQVNRETAISNATMSHVNQTSPHGSQTWKLDTSTAGGKAWQDYQDKYAAWQQDTNPDKGGAPGMPDKGIDPQWSLSTTLDPTQQKLFDAQNAIGQKALDTGLLQLNRVSDTLATPLSTAGLPDRVTSITAPNGELTSSVTNAGDVKTAVDKTGRGVSYDIAASKGVVYNPGYAALQYGPGAIKDNLDYSGVSALPGKGDFSALTQQAQDASYNQATSRLDPMFQKQQKELEAKLANQGLTPGSEAWAAQVDAFNRGKNDAYSQAAYSSVGAGDALQQALFNQALAARQQGVGEINAQGQFANAAEAQRFGQQITGRQQYINEANGSFDRANAAQAQDFGQSAARAQFSNAAQAQEYGQNQQDAQFANAAQNQKFQQGLMGANLSNSVYQQGLSNAYQAAQFNNAERTNALNEASTLRSAPLAEMAGLMGMNSYTAPTFGQVATPQMAAPDLMGATYQSYNAQVAAAQAAAQARGGMMGSLAGLGGSALTAGAMYFSDKRLKVGVRALGERLFGLPLYVFWYVWGGPERVGVMAQDVAMTRPEAVHVVDGYLAVDYAALAA